MALKETPPMSKTQRAYEQTFAQLFDPAHAALDGIRLDSRQRHVVTGLVAGRAAEQLSRRR
jgi:hypothetical protein